MKYGMQNFVDALSAAPSGGGASADVREMARKGTHGDDSMIHAKRGEMVIDPARLPSGLMAGVRQAIYQGGGDPNASVIGSNAGRANPNTGAQMMAPDYDYNNPARRPHNYNANTPFADLPDYMYAPDSGLAQQPGWFTDAYEYGDDGEYNMWEDSGWDYEDDIEGTWRDQKPFYNYGDRAIVNNQDPYLPDTDLFAMYDTMYGPRGQGSAGAGTRQIEQYGHPGGYRKKDELGPDEAVEDGGTGLTNLDVARMIWGDKTGDVVEASGEAQREMEAANRMFGWGNNRTSPITQNFLRNEYGQLITDDMSDMDDKSFSKAIGEKGRVIDMNAEFVSGGKGDLSAMSDWFNMASGRGSLSSMGIDPKAREEYLAFHNGLSTDDENFGDPEENFKGDG